MGAIWGDSAYLKNVPNSTITQCHTLNRNVSPDLPPHIARMGRIEPTNFAYQKALRRAGNLGCLVN